MVLASQQQLDKVPEMKHILQHPNRREVQSLKETQKTGGAVTNIYFWLNLEIPKMSLYLVPVVIRRAAGREGVDTLSPTFTPSTASSNTRWASGHIENQLNSYIFRKIFIA